MNIKKTVVISRNWDNPKIEITITDAGISLEISLEDFCKAVVAEAKHPALTFTRQKLEDQIVGAIDLAVEKIKAASAQVA